MKKFLLPFLLSWVIITVFVGQTSAQTKSVENLEQNSNTQAKEISCEEFKDVFNTKECPFAIYWPTEKAVWCYNSLEEVKSYATNELSGGFGEYIDAHPPNYSIDFDYEACLDSRAQERGNSSSFVSESDETTDKKDETTDKKSQQENPKQGRLPVFIAEWFSRFSQTIDGLTALPGAFADVVYEDKFHLAPDVPKLSDLTLDDMFQGHWYPDDNAPDRLPAITSQDEQKAWEFRRNEILSNRDNLTFIEGQGQAKGSNLNQFIPIANLSTEYLPVVYQGVDLEPIIVRYSWETNSGAVINSSGWERIEFKKPVTDDGGSITRAVKFKEGKGEVEIKVKNEAPAQSTFKVETDFFDLFVIQTHFWISQSQDKKLAVIGVYEGKVEVKTKDGKTVTVTPEGNKPGVLVLTRKLSITRLVLVGVVLAGVIGGIFFLRRKRVAPFNFGS